MHLNHEISYTCLPGYAFLECLGRTAFGEVWRVRAPDGRMRAVKFIHGFTRGGTVSDPELESAIRLKFIRHPALTSVEAVEIEEGRLVIVTDLAEETLRDRFDQCRAAGLQGVPRAELLGYLKDAAAALDFLDQQHLLHHLGLNPRSLLLAGGQLKVADYGLIQLLWIPGGQPISQLNTRYAAPELFDERLSRSCDQYSLALIYQEMLTGQFAHRRQNMRQLIAARLTEEPDLDGLPFDDRGVIGRALHRDPRERFSSCTALIHALETRTGEHAEGALALLGSAPDTPFFGAWPWAARPSPLSPTMDQLVAELVQAAAQSSQVEILQKGGLRCQILPDGTLRHQCAAWLPNGVAKQKLQGFIQQWQGQVVEAQESHFLFHLGTPRSLWQKLTAKKGIEIEIRLIRRPAETTKLTEVVVRMRFLGRPSASGAALLKQVGPYLLDNLHHHLLATPEQRVQERFAFQRPLCVSPVRSTPDGADPIECRGKDISVSGIGFFAPYQPPLASQVYIYQPSGAESSSFAIPAAVTRVQPTGTGWYEAGARFILDHQVPLPDPLSP